VLSWTQSSLDSFVPRFDTQPRSLTALIGDNVAFGADVSSAFPLSYQWLRGCAFIFNATNSTLVLSNASPEQLGAYRLLVYNEFFPVLSAISEPAFLEFGPEQKEVSRDKFEDLFLDTTTPGAASARSSRLKPSFLPVTAGVIGSQLFNNTGAGSQLGESNHCGVVGGASRWFTLRPSDNGTLVIDTIGSSIDTVLSVYEGTNLFTLTFIACDNDGAPDGIRSRLEFAATQDTDYQIAVDGVGGEQGNITMNWFLGDPPSVTLLSTNLFVTRGNTASLGATVGGAPAPALQWFHGSTPVPNGTNSVLIITNAQPADAGSYSLFATNSLGSITSATATLTVLERMQIDPATPLVLAGNQFRFRVLNVAGMSSVIIQASTNLTAWVPVQTNSPAGSFLDVTITNTPLPSFRYYRSVGP
jgi:hypothetical protein